MAVAIDLRKIEEWFIHVQGWKIVQAISDGDLPVPIRNLPEVTLEQVKTIAANCEWVEIEDISETPYVQQGILHPECLEIGWGDPISAYRGQPGSGVYFFNAYKI